MVEFDFFCCLPQGQIFPNAAEVIQIKKFKQNGQKVSNYLIYSPAQCPGLSQIPYHFQVLQQETW